MARTLIATTDDQVQAIPAGKAAQLDILARGGVQGGGSGTPIMLDVCHEGRTYRVCVRNLPDGRREMWIDRYRVVVGVQEEREAKLGGFVRASAAGAAALRVRAPMPGLIREIAVKEGDAVTKGQRLLTLEAMKMENEITSPGDGVVGKFTLSPGESVEKDQVLIQLISQVK